MKNELRVDNVLQSLIDGALLGTDINILFEEFCKNAVEVGVPLLRAQLGMRTLHPLVESVDFVWWRDRKLE